MSAKNLIPQLNKIKSQIGNLTGKEKAYKAPEYDEVIEDFSKIKTTCSRIDPKDPHLPAAKNIIDNIDKQLTALQQKGDITDDPDIKKPPTGEDKPRL
ncbi:hypothetical protein N7922_13860 [Kosakonia sp. ML.JS2a]|uniref:hypothetical protein n=1 Tax=Kosakonia sp. ML.JS2a TaxID=2980557 RepID=UPI0021D7D2A7|nr:hypothetical protein [Kosakonia sp. ML.JS2a]UXY08977.1 hypothetical protein N7922_13860 [Kosakonia sp. ML.JS2a]